MTQDQLQGIGLLAEPEPVQERVPQVRRTPTGGRSWPDYVRCGRRCAPNRSGKGPDRSLADYAWCKFAAQRRFTVEEIAAELPNVSEKARERIEIRGTSRRRRRMERQRRNADDREAVPNTDNTYDTPQPALISFERSSKS